MHYGRSCIWLGLGAVLLAVGSRSSAFPLAMWLALALLLRAARTLPPWPGGPFLLTALYVALAIGNRGVLPVGDPLYFLVITAIGVPTLLPFAADRLLARRVPGWAATLAFPAAWVAVELVN
ncbi:MAG TPA: nitrilase, partial [Vicinamibacteria bacterium]|nr:nitrilase [Vicinamibacteria bacterium]